MSIKQEFLQFVDDLINSSPDETIKMSEGAKIYLDALRNNNDEIAKPQFTDNGKLILQYIKENSLVTLWKAKTIAEGLGISSRAVSGAMRKLVTDGYVEKVGQDPVIYTITTKGKEINLEGDNYEEIND